MASLQPCLAQIEDLINSHMHQRHSNHENLSFITEAKLHEVWHNPSVDLQPIYERIPLLRNPEQLRDHIKFLSLLIYARWRDWDVIARCIQNGLPDTELPYTFPDLKKWFPGVRNQDIDSLYYYQYAFCPVVIELGAHHEYPFKRMRLPILTEEVLGEGSYGVVTKIKIPPGHMLERRSDGVTDYLRPSDREFTCARKKFTSSLHGTFEHGILNRVKRFDIQHPCIMKSFASVALGSEEAGGEVEFNLFFECALFDLHKFLKCDNPPGIQVEHINPYELLRSTELLAQALSIIHQDYNLCHMDLKPNNILVMRPKDGYPLGRWVITDFGIASFNKEKSSRPTTWGDVIAKTEASRSRSAASATNVFPGPFQPPEYETALRPRGEIPREKGDVWSFGCTLIMVYLYAIGGARAINQLEAMIYTNRQAIGMDDLSLRRGYFYCAINRKPQFYTPLKQWLDDLSAKIGGWALDTWKLIQRMMSIEATVRMSASQIKVQLGEIMHRAPTQNMWEVYAQQMEMSLRSSRGPPTPVYTPTMPSEKQVDTPPIPIRRRPATGRENKTASATTNAEYSDLRAHHVPGPLYYEAPSSDSSRYHSMESGSSRHGPSGSDSSRYELPESPKSPYNPAGSGPSTYIPRGSESTLYGQSQSETLVDSSYDGKSQFEQYSSTARHTRTQSGSYSDSSQLESSPSSQRYHRPIVPDHDPSAFMYYGGQPSDYINTDLTYNQSRPESKVISPMSAIREEPFMSSGSAAGTASGHGNHTTPHTTPRDAPSRGMSVVRTGNSISPQPFPVDYQRTINRSKHLSSTPKCLFSLAGNASRFAFAGGTEVLIFNYEGGFNVYSESPKTIPNSSDVQWDSIQISESFLLLRKRRKDRKADDSLIRLIALGQARYGTHQGEWQGIVPDSNRAAQVALSATDCLYFCWLKQIVVYSCQGVLLLDYTFMAGTPTTGNKKAIIENVETSAFDPTGRYLVVISQYRWCLWDLTIAQKSDRPLTAPTRSGRHSYSRQDYGVSLWSIALFHHPRYIVLHDDRRGIKFVCIDTKPPNRISDPFTFKAKPKVMAISPENDYLVYVGEETGMFKKKFSVFAQRIEYGDEESDMLPVFCEAEVLKELTVMKDATEFGLSVIQSGSDAVAVVVSNTKFVENVKLPGRVDMTLREV